MAEKVELGDADVHVWGIDPQTVTDTDVLQRYEAILSPDERERRARLRLEKLRHDYLVAHALVRASLSRYADVAPGDWTFQRNKHGRPELSGPAPAPPLSFNLSHTDGMAVCAVARRRAVGIDVENRLRPMRFMQVARRFFAPSEVEALTALPEEERPAGFYRFWTLKEAYVKARGVGIASMPLASFWFRLDDAAPPAISFAHPEAEQRRWEFSLFHPTDRHIVALAVEQSGAGTTSAQLRLTLPLAPAR